MHQPVAFGTIQLSGPPSFLAIGEDIHPVVCHQGFARSLLNWMREIRWTPSASVDGLDVSQDTSSLEMFWVMFMIRRHSQPFYTSIMNGLGFGMTLRWI